MSTIARRLPHAHLSFKQAQIRPLTSDGVDVSQNQSAIFGQNSPERSSHGCTDAAESTGCFTPMCFRTSCFLLRWRCPHSVRNGWASVCLPLPAFGRHTPLRRVCCCGPGGQEMSMVAWPAVSSRRAAARRTAANAGSATLSADAGS